MFEEPDPIDADAFGELDPGELALLKTTGFFDA
jgi:hypothetical protein